MEDASNNWGTGLIIGILIGLFIGIMISPSSEDIKAFYNSGSGPDRRV